MQRIVGKGVVASSSEPSAPSRFTPAMGQDTPPLLVSHASRIAAILKTAATACLSVPWFSALSSRLVYFAAISDIAEGAMRLVAQG